MNRSMFRSALAFVVGAAALQAQQSTRIFDAPLVPFGAYHRVHALLDFNGDGHRDALSAFGASPNATSVALFSGDGAGGFVLVDQPLVVASSNPATAMALPIDLSGNVTEDFVVFTNLAFHVFAWTGLQASVVQAQSFGTNATTDALRIAVVADGDGDGDDDILIRTATALHYYRGEPAPFYFVPAGIVPLPTGVVGALEAHDLTGDNVREFVLLRASGPSSAEILSYSALGGTLVADAVHVVPGLLPMEFAAGDSDGDGDVDLHICGTAPGQTTFSYLVLRRAAPALLTLEPTPIPGGPFTGFADVDGDNDLDGVCCGGGGGGGGPNTSPVTTNNGASAFEISINVGGVLAPAFAIPSVGAVRLAAAEDLDGDGDVDLLGGRAIYFSEGSILSNPLRPGRVGASGSDPFGRGTVDLDMDGDPDLDTGYSATATVRRNDGAGGVSAWLPQFPNPPVNAVYSGPGLPGDWDGDGDTDVIVEQRNNGAYFATRLLRNQGGGSFSPAVAAIPGGQRMYVPPAGGPDAGIPATAAVPGDFDGDGDLDLVSRWGGGAGTGVGSALWTNNGTGFFTQTSVLFDVYATAAGDLNGDGRADLVTMEGYAFGALLPQVRMALPTGGFGPPAALTDTYNLSTIKAALGDFDGDGDLDIAHGAGALIGFQQNSGGVFSPAPGLPLGDYASPTSIPAPLVAVDFDGDGLCDLMAPASSAVPEGRSFYRRTGPFTFSLSRHLVPAEALSDVDGDGDLDAVGTQIARNVLHDGPAAGYRVQYGTGFPGSGGVVPVIGDVGPFRTGVSGTLTLRGARGGATAFLIIGGAPLDLPTPYGGNLYTTPDVVVSFTLDGPAGQAGRGGFDLDWYMPPGFEGLTIYHQWAIFDAGAAFGVAATSGLHVTIGL